MFRPFLTALLSVVLFAAMTMAGAVQTAGTGYPPIGPAEPERPTVVVEEGDHMWKISKRELAAGLQREPGNQEIHPFWVETIEMNLDSLRSGDPDLIFPGEELTLPDVADD